MIGPDVITNEHGTDQSYEAAILDAMQRNDARYGLNQNYRTATISWLVRSEFGLHRSMDELRAACVRLARRGKIERRKRLTDSGAILWKVVRSPPES